MQALKVAISGLNVCEKLDSHYYSQTYGNCYWCDRSTNLGVDIFPGVVKANSSAVVEFYGLNLSALNSGNFSFDHKRDARADFFNL